VTLTLHAQLVRGLATISQELSGITQKLTSLAEENHALKAELHHLSSQIATLPLPWTPPPHLHIFALQSAMTDLSHRVKAPAPPLQQAPAPSLPPAHTAVQGKAASTVLPGPQSNRGS